MPDDEKSLAERWYEEQQAWQRTMREYADSMVKDEQFLMHLGNAMRGSLLAGVPYPQAAPAAGGFDAAAPAEGGSEALAEILFTLKRIDGRLRDLEASVEDLAAARATAPVMVEAPAAAPAKPAPATAAAPKPAAKPAPKAAPRTAAKAAPKPKTPATTAAKTPATTAAKAPAAPAPRRRTARTTDGK